jgi:hypothetical protein
VYLNAPFSKKCLLTVRSLASFVFLHRTEIQFPIAGVFKQLSESEAVQRPTIPFDDVPALCTPGKRAQPRCAAFSRVFTAFSRAFFV